MPSSILNSDDGVISGTSGLKSSGGDDGELAVQSNGTEVAKFKTTELVINDGGANYDFRVEGDTNANLLCVDASTDRVGIGTNTPTRRLHVNSGTADNVALFESTDGTALSIYKDNATTVDVGVGAIGNNLVFYNNTERARINSSGDLILVGSTAQKATGTTWSNPSDQRLKDNIRDYTKGTAELMQVRVREWEYNGKGGTIEGTKGLGVVADEVMVVLPDTVANYEAKLNADDEEVTSIKKFDATEITWLLVKTVQELKAELDEAKARIAALEAVPGNE